MIKKYKEFVEEGLLRHYNRWHNGEQRKEDKHEYVDLGLPSGLLWAKCNLGADTEYESGGYYAWGETEEKENYNIKTYKFGNNLNKLTKYNKKDKLTILEPEDDAVHVNWGKNWRMPTKEEFEELIKHTTSEWIKDYNGTGVSGRLFTSKKNKNSIFIPAGGFYNYSRCKNKNYTLYYWTSCKYDGLQLNDSTYYILTFMVYLGFNIRGVMEK